MYLTTDTRNFALQFKRKKSATNGLNRIIADTETVIRVLFRISPRTGNRIRKKLRYDSGAHMGVYKLKKQTPNILCYSPFRKGYYS
jgi:hypothetical protein